MARPRGPNYELNRRRMAGWATGESGSGGAAVATVASPQATVRPLVTAFIKSMLSTGIAQQFARGATAETSKTYELYDDRNRLISDGVMLRPPWRLKEADLRKVTYGGNIAGAIVQLRVDDAKIHARPDKTLGYWAKLEDPDLEPTAQDKKRIQGKLQLVKDMGTRLATDWYDRENLEQVLDMATGDVLTIDKIAALRTRDRRGETIDARYLDPATIFQVHPVHGYRGDRNITHVQVIDFQVVEVYERGRIILKNKRALSDREYRGHGLSPTEAVIHEIMGSIYAIKQNLDRFSGRNPPKFIMTSKSSVPEEVRELFELVWEAAYSGGRMNFQVPLIHNIEDLEVHKIDFENDMIWEKWMNWTANMTLARYAVDEAELGLRLGHGQSLSEPSVEGRIRLSRNRGHGALMRFHESWLGALFADPPTEKRPVVIYFAGTTDEDRNAKLDRDVKRISNFETLDAIRAEYDLPSMGEVGKDYFPDDEEKQKKYALLGALIYNQYFAQQYAAVIGGGQEQADGFGDGEDQAGAGADEDFDLDRALGFSGADEEDTQSSDEE